MEIFGVWQSVEATNILDSVKHFSRMIRAPAGRIGKGGQCVGKGNGVIAG